MAEVVVTAFRLEIVIGASFAWQFSWKSDDVLVPLPAGTTALCQVRPSLYDDDVLAQFMTTPVLPGDGLITLTDPGVTALSMEPEQTALLLPVNDAVFDIQYTFTTGEVLVKLGNGQGLLTIRGAVTQ